MNEIFRPSLQVTFLSFLSVTLFGTDSVLAFNNPVQPLQVGNKFNSSGELAAELPPRVFPHFSDEDDVPMRQGEEVPPSTFPKDPVDISHEQNDVTQLSNKGTERVTVRVTKETSTKKSASEVLDLLNSNTYSNTVYEDGTEGPIQDTITVTGPNVLNNSKTHEEDVTAPSMGNKENDATNNSVTSVLPTSDANEKASDNLNISNVVGSNVSNTEDIIHSGNTTEFIRNKENGTSPVDALETYNDVPVTEVDTNLKDDERKQSVSEKIVQTKDEVKSGIRTMKNETTAKPESVSSTTQHLSTIKFTSTLPVQQSTIATLQPMMKAESTTSVNISENLIDHKAEDTPVAMAASQKHADHSHASSGKSSAFLQPTESAAILAAVFVGVALIGYVGLLVWRRVLEKRYGNREMLVNEDDFYDTNDLKNFEL